jgi:hypothetical protein
MGDHRIVGGIRVFGDVEIFLDDTPRVREEGPVSAAVLAVRKGAACPASLILWMIFDTQAETPVLVRVLLSQRGIQQETAKRRLSHVCTKHTVNLWGYHRL